MRRGLFGLAVVTIAACFGSSVPASACTVATPDAVPIVVNSSIALADINRVIGTDTYRIMVSRSEAALRLSELRATPGVRWAELDTTMSVEAAPSTPPFSNTPNDPELPNQWALPQVGAAGAWAQTHGSASIRVAVLDSGVKADHPDLVGKIDSVDGCGLANPLVDSGHHGTEVAGIIAANTNNGVGIAGLGWDTRVVSVRVLTGGAGLASDVAQGIRCSADAGIPIVNLSLTGSYNQAVADAVVYAQARGVLITAAAGNQGADLTADLTVPQFPADMAGVISVAANDMNDQLASFSYRGTWVKLTAPGYQVETTCTFDPADKTKSCPDPTLYTQVAGTSFSAPYAAAAAALVMAAYPGITAEGVSRRLTTSAAHIAGTGTSFAYGRLDVNAALSMPRGGSWLATANGKVVPLADYARLGSLSGPLNRPIVGGARTPSGNGYWLVASDGGIFTFGDAGFFGSTGAMTLAKPVVGMASTPSGHGYWLVAADGGIFTFGDAGFFGSTGAMRLNQPVTGMVTTTSGSGYSLVARDGGVFTFGDALFYGSADVTSSGNYAVALIQ
jgi:hypothetical protein